MVRTVLVPFDCESVLLVPISSSRTTCVVRADCRLCGPLERNGMSGCWYLHNCCLKNVGTSFHNRLSGHQPLHRAFYHDLAEEVIEQLLQALPTDCAAKIRHEPAPCNCRGEKSVHRMPSLPQWDCSLRRYTMRRRTDEAIGLQALTIHAEDVNTRRFGSLFLRCTNPPSPGFHEIFPIASHLLHFADSVNPF